MNSDGVKMLKKYKNNFIEIIKKEGLNPTDFSADDSDDIFVISCDNAPLEFGMECISHTEFEYQFTRFDMGFPTELHRGFVNIEDIYIAFTGWLNLHVKSFLDEESTPDLWSYIESQKELISDIITDKTEFQLFRDEEKKQIRVCIDEFRLLIVEHYSPSKDELKVIDARLKYLSGSLDRLNKFDWLGLAIQTVLCISIALSLDSEKGKMLFELFKQVFAQITKLLQG